MSITDDIKRVFQTGNIVTKLIIVNIAVFVLANMFNLFAFLLQTPNSFIFDLLALPAYLPNVLLKPWTIFTYMFFHWDFIHIIFNILIFYWFANIFKEYLGEKPILKTYIIGGLAGGILYIIFYNLFPVFNPYLKQSVALGASASIYAIVVAISTYVPNYRLNLLLFGQVKLKYIALAYVIIDIISIPKGNAGGHIAHIGGAIWGFIYVLNLKIDNINFKRNRKSKLKVKYKRPLDDYEYNAQKATKQAKTDAILEKIAKSGYASLSAEEKEFLFNQSNKS